MRNRAKHGSWIVLVVAALIFPTDSVFAAPTGKKCTEIGLSKVYAGKLFTCIKKKKKKVWDSGTQVIATEIVSLRADSRGEISFAFSATREDRCNSFLIYGGKTLETKYFPPAETYVRSASFFTKLSAGLARLNLECSFSGQASKSLQIEGTSYSTPASPIQTPTPKSSTVSPTPSTSPSPILPSAPTSSPSPSSSPANPFADAAAKAAAEAEAKKKEAEERARTLEEEREKQRQLSISQAVSRLLENYCGRRQSCDIGKTGPGGGLIFYHSPYAQWWGTYMEVRVTGTQSSWCDKPTLALTKNVTDSSLRRSLGKELGKGKQNTLLMLSACGSGAANVASAFRGGGFDDWYLPSHKELDQICKFAAGTTVGEEHVCHRSANTTNLWNYFPSIGEYWSSSEYTDPISPEGNFAWFIQFYDGKNGPLDKKAIRPVLAIRAYGPKSG